MEIDDGYEEDGGDGSSAEDDEELGEDELEEVQPLSPTTQSRFTDAAGITSTMASNVN